MKAKKDCTQSGFLCTFLHCVGWVMDLWVTFADRQLAQPFNHFHHFTANLVWVPSTFIHYWLEMKCLCCVAVGALSHPPSDEMLVTSVYLTPGLLSFLVYVCSPYSKAKKAGEKKMLSQSLRWMAAAACCHGNYLLIFQQSFLSDKGRAPLSR